MIKPPAMGVFAREPQPQGRASASNPSASPSILQPQSLASDPTTSIQGSSRVSTIPHPTTAEDLASDPTNQDDETVQDDDDDQGTVDEEAGIIRCICGCDDDDGFTIQCDRCLVWQHCACFGMSQASVPDEYLCEQCEPRPVDVAFAQAHQQKRKNNEARKALMDRNLKRQAQALASNQYNQNYLANDAVSSPTSSTHPATVAVPLEHPSAAHQPTTAPTATSANRSRKPSQALDLSNTQFVVPEVPASAGASRGGKQRKGQKGSRRGYDTPSAVSTPVRGVFTPGSSHERIDDPFDAAEQLEAWHVEFTPVAKNMVSDASILENLAAAMLDWEDGSPLKAIPGPSGRQVVPTASSLTRHAKLAEVYPASSSASSPSSPSPHAPDSPGAYDNNPAGISAVGQECVPVELTGPSLADLACRTYVKQISETASAGVFSNLLYVNNSADEPQRGWCASRAFSRPVMHGLFAESSIPAGAFISELRGELYSADTYRNDPINQYAALGATKPHVHLLPPPLNIAIDARRYGNEARFARFSCHPNAVIRPILFRPNGQPSARSRTNSRAQSPALTPAAALSMTARQQRYADTPPLEARSEEPQLLFGIFALTDISRTHEITLGWEWDDSHIVHFLPELVQNPYLEPRDGDMDADKHTANMVALAEKGEFPYADTEFSVKMSTVAAALLGSVLCACIGSAAPPGGGGGASANNGRKQDCAVAQMLRVGNGMSLLNVTMPGKTNRRARLPDFSPLVGIRRFWRPYSLPSTPETSVKDEDPAAEAALSEALAAQGEAETMQLLDDMEADGEIGCGGIEGLAKRGKAGRRKKSNRMDVDGDETKSGGSDSDDVDETRSNASSLTDPLSGLSDQDTLSEDEDEDLMDALRAADGDRARRQSRKGKAHGYGNDAVDPELSGLFILPPKKRSMRTRIKATIAASEDEDKDGTDDDANDQDKSHDKVKATKGRKSAENATKVKSGSKRKGKADAGRGAFADFSSDEEDKAYNDETPAKKRRKSGNIDPSSPLSSVPSPNSAEPSLSPPPPVPRLSAKHRAENERRLSDVELSKKKREAKRNRDRNAKAPQSRPKESASKRRKREETRIHRNAILNLGDTESSEEDLSEDESQDETSKPQREEDADVTMQDAASGASTPRASKQVVSAESPGTASVSAPTSSELQQRTKKERPESVVAADEAKSTKKDSSAKAKKVRRILSDSEQSSDEEGAAGKDATAPSSPMAVKKEEPGQGAEDAQTTTATSETKGAADATAKASSTDDGKEAEDTPAIATAAVPVPAPTPAPEVKKEEPRVKLSLAEYKRRLAERRVSEQQSGNNGTPASAPLTPLTPLTPSIATPTPSEGPPWPSPAVERTDPLPSAATVPVRASEPVVASTPAETANAPTGSAPPAASGTDAVDAGKTASSAPRSLLFTSISAPTAIRSVEIPKSPSPEPATSISSPVKQEAALDANKAPTEASTSSVEAGEVVASSLSTASVDTPALLARLGRARGLSVTQQPGLGEKDGQQVPTAVGTSAGEDGFVKPASINTAVTGLSSASNRGPGSATTPSAMATPARSPSLGPTREGPRMPASPSGSAGGFNPPKAPRAFMSPPSGNLPPPTGAPASNTAPVPAAAAVAAATASAATSTPIGISAPPTTMASTPARISISGRAAGIGNTPSTASSTSSSASTSRYPGAGLTSPTPSTTALSPVAAGPERAMGGYGGRAFAGVPKGPASMREDAWAEARELREQRDYGPALPAQGGRDGGWGERTRGEMTERDPRGGWGRDRREPYPRDSAGGFRDRVPAAGGAGPGGDVAPSGGLAGRLDTHAPPHHSYGGYRRPSASEYDEPSPTTPHSPYDRSADPYNRGIMVRGRSLGGPGSAAAAGGGYRGEYDDPGPPPSGGRGGYRGWGGGGRGRPRGGGGRGGGRGGGWGMR